jgi:hypothetical protein
MELRTATVNSLANTSVLEARLWLGDRDRALLAIASFIMHYLGWPAGRRFRAHLSEMATIRPGGILTIAVPGHLWRVPTWRLDAPWRFAVP